MCSFWSKDSVEKVVLSAKHSNQILVVLVEGEDELSHKVKSALNIPGDQFSSRNYFNLIGLCISEGSENYKHFAKIYSKKDASKESNNFVSFKVPCVMFIGALGLPLAVIEVSDFQCFQKRLHNVLGKFSGTNAKEATKLVYEVDEKDNKYPHQIHRAYEEAREAILRVEKKNKLASGDVSVMEKSVRLVSNNCDSQLGNGALFNVKKTGQEKSSETQHPIVNLPTSSEDIIDKNEEEICNSNVVQRHIRDRQETKIVFRLQNGKVVSEMFSVNTLLLEVRKYVKEQLGIRSCDLSFLSRLNEADDHLTLDQLNMVPSAVLLVVPVTGGQQSLLKKGFSRLSSFFWSLFMPFFTYVQYLNSYIFTRDRRPQGRQIDSSTSSNSPPPPPGGSGPHKHQPSQNRFNSNQYRSSSSNIYTLRNMNDDNNSQNTYNGNSTQQMP